MFHRSSLQAPFHSLVPAREYNHKIPVSQLKPLMDEHVTTFHESCAFFPDDELSAILGQNPTAFSLKGPLTSFVPRPKGQKNKLPKAWFRF